MDETIYLDENYSTTRLITKDKPLLEQKTEYKLEPKLFLLPNAERKGEGGLRTKGYFKKSYDNKPLISIVTVVYNGEKHLEQTINSILEQTYDNVEYIIIDGGSTDGTVDIIKKYEDQIDYWVSEPDTGIYNAMNKGASLCSGDYVAFLNADDWYNGDTILSVINVILKHFSDFIFANVDLFNEEDEYTYTYNSHFNQYYRHMPFGHPTLFVKRVLLFLDPFELKYPTASDYDFICKIIKYKLPFTYLKKSIVNFRLGGISTMMNTDKELFLIRSKHFGVLSAILSWILTTRQPGIKKLVNFLMKIKYFITKRRFI